MITANVALDRGVSDQQRNQILGHARSKTYYISSNVVVDVQATFLGTASRADLIKEIGKLCLRRDPNLPKRLSDHQRTQAHQHPDVIRAQKEKDLLAQNLKDDFGTIKNGSKSSDGIQHTRVQSKLRALKLRVEREAFTKILRDFHSAADLDHMVAQLNGEEPASKMLTTVPHVLEERRQLAHDLFQRATESSFAKMVDTLFFTLLRQRPEMQQPRRRPRRSDHQAVCLHSTFSSGGRRNCTQRRLYRSCAGP